MALALAASQCALAQPMSPHAAVYNYKGADRAARLLERAKAEGSVTLYTSLAPTESGPLAEAFEKKFGVPCLQSYGMTELLLVSSNLPSDPAVRGTVGQGVATLVLFCNSVGI